MLARRRTLVRSHLLSRGQKITFPERNPMQIRFGEMVPACAGITAVLGTITARAGARGGSCIITI